jgi:hypothetical protein
VVERLAARVEEVARKTASAVAGRTALREELARAANAAPPAEPPAYGQRITAEDLRRLLDTIVAVEAETDALASTSCANWPALEARLGGPPRCRERLGAYYRGGW